VRALHRGIAPGGRYLYPAFPYTSFTAMSRDDALSIKAYLFSLPPQHVANKEDSLSFPFNQRWGVAFWNLAFLSDQRFAPDPAQSAAVNRGAYLATALGHCGECHTPRNLAFALESGRKFAGDVLQGWHAYNITSDERFGIGAWSDAQLASFLSSAHAQDRGSAAGPVAEAVEHSLQYLTSEDISALVAYLRAVAAQTGNYAVNVMPAPGAQEPQDELGRHVFEGGCANCHEYNGDGRQTVYASLAGSRSVDDPAGANVTQMMLNGAKYRIKQRPRRLHAAIRRSLFRCRACGGRQLCDRALWRQDRSRHTAGCRQAATGIAQEERLRVQPFSFSTGRYKKGKPLTIGGWWV
jgi:mono/diheme cytochrome c family protein